MGKDLDSVSEIEQIYGALTKEKIVTLHTEIGKENVVYIKPFNFAFKGNQYNVKAVNSTGIFIQRWFRRCI